MEADKARETSHLSAERMRIASDSARDNAQLEADSWVEGLQQSIEVAARLQRDALDKSIGEAANSGRNWVNQRFTERISASRNSRDEVAFIETIADATSALVVDSLEADGFEVSSSTREARDFRDSPDAQPEYYETTFSINW